MRVQGVTGSKSNVRVVDDELFGSCLLMKDSPYNLVSWSKIRKDGFTRKHVENGNGSDYFIVSRPGKCLLYFRLSEKEGVYGCNIKKIIYEDKPLWIGDGNKSMDAKLEGRLILQLLHLGNEPHQVNAMAGLKNDGFSQQEEERIERVLKIHDALSHCGDNILRTMLIEGRFDGLKEQDLDNARKKYGKCQECVRGKTKNIMMKKSKFENLRDVNVGEYLHVDIMYIEKNMYLVSTDELTGYINAIPIKSREREVIMEALKRIISFYCSCGWKVKRICSDREGGFASNRDELAAMNIQLYQSSTEGHDSRIERQIGTIKGKIRSSFYSLPYKLPRDWLDYLTVFVCQSQNLVPNNKTTPRCPFEIVCTSRNMDWTYNISFGDIVLARVPYVKSTGSLSERSEYGIVLGRDLFSNKVFTIYKIDIGTIVYRNQLDIVQYKHLPEYIKVAMNRKAKIYGFVKEEDIAELENTESKNSDVSIARSNEIPSVRSVFPDSIPSNSDSYLDDYHNVYNDNELIQIEEEHDDDDDGMKRFEESKFDGEGEEREEKEEYLDAIRRIREDEISKKENINLTISQAYEKFGEEKINEATKKELKQLVDNGTFQGCTRQEALQHTLIPTNTVAAEKEDNNVKVRIVAKGDRQDRSIYKESEISSPTIRTESLITMIAIAGSKGMRLCAFDVAGAYLKASLPSDTKIAIMFKRESSKVLKEMLPDLELDHHGRCYGVLQKGLYGLLQAGKLWYQLLSDTLIEIGYQQCKSEPCLYYRYINDKIYMIAVYVDDLLMAFEENNEVERVKSELESKFGKMKFNQNQSIKYRGLQIEQTKGGIHLHQSDAIDDLIMFYLDEKERTDMGKSTPSTGTLMLKLPKEQLMPAKEPERFRTALAKAIYIATQSRFDIKLVTSVLSANTSNPNTDDEKRMKHLVKYLMKTKEQSLFFPLGNPIVLSAEADASWLSNKDLTGQTGGVIRIGNCAVHVISKRQKMIARSSTEAEIIAAEAIASEVQWMRQLLAEIGFPQLQTILYQDNQATITLIENGRPTSKTKHMQWREMRLNELIRSETIKLKYRNSSELSADLLTKPFTGEAFKILLDKIINENGRRSEEKQAKIKKE